MGRHGNLANYAASVAEGNVSGRHIFHVDAVGFQFAQDRLDLGPVVAKLFGFVGAPVVPDFLGKVWGTVEVGTGEIENERPRDDGHFDGPQLVVKAQDLRDFAATDVLDAALLQTQIDV